MFDSIMQQIGGANVQVPLGYVVTAAAVLFGTYWVVKKVIMLAKMVVLGVLARFSVAMLGSGGLFIAGLAGVGNSVGTIKDGVVETKTAQVSFVDKDTISKVVTNDKDNGSIRILAFDYAREQDKKALETQTSFVSTNTDPNIENKIGSRVVPWTIFSTSIGLILVSIVWTLRRWHQQPLEQF